MNFDKKSSGSVKNIVISNGAFLSKSIDRLPNGIIDKAAPGMGATTLELNAPRHSIIVEPTKVLAYNKAASIPDALYVGSKMHSTDKEISSSRVRGYIAKQIKDGKHIKILVVADSLWKVMTAMEELDVKKEDFFLMFDEIDTYQIDSSYRNKLEDVVDYYFEFPEENRCMVSATILPFSDPRLNLSETKTRISYKSNPKRRINLFRTSNPNLLTVNAIEQLLKYQKKSETIQDESKIVVAYNSIFDIKEILFMLPPKIQEICGVGCSEKSAQQVDSKFVRIESDGILPTQVTFITSAYFNGVDILDRFHLISVVNKNVNHTMLSEHRFYQIQGRARNKTLSETIIHSHIVEEQGKQLSIEQKRQEYLDASKSTLGMLECAHKHFKPSDTSHQILSQIRKLTTELSADNATFVRTERKTAADKIVGNLKPNIVEAYFNIDSAIERYRILTEVYRSNDTVKEHLLRSCVIQQEDDVYLEQSDLQKEFRKLHREEKNLTQEEEIKETVEYLASIDFSYVEQYIKISSGISKMIAIRYKELGALFNKPELILPKLVTHFEKRKYHNFARSVVFQSIPDNKVFKGDILKAFQYNKLYSPEEIKNKLNNVYQKPEIGINRLASSKTAVNHLSCYFKLKKRRLPGTTRFGYEIVQRNPLNLKNMSKKTYGRQNENAEPHQQITDNFFLGNEEVLKSFFEKL